MPNYLIRGGLKFDGDEAALRQHLTTLGFANTSTQDEDEDMRDRYISAAQELSREGEIEVDNDAIVSFGDDDGAYVAAWLWVPTPHLEDHDVVACTCDENVIDDTCDDCGARHCPCPCSDCGCDDD